MWISGILDLEIVNSMFSLELSPGDLAHRSFRSRRVEVDKLLLGAGESGERGGRQEEVIEAAHVSEMPALTRVPRAATLIE